jgi:hypothetical protein
MTGENAPSKNLPKLFNDATIRAEIHIKII